MNWFESALYWLGGRMETPQGYGIFHWFCIVLVIASTVILCLRFGKVDEKNERKILLFGWIVMLILEIYKQLLYSVDFSETVTWDYAWYSFPFQFCSSPLYLLPIAALSHHEKIRDAVRMFLSTFSLFAGLAVYIYTDDVFSSYIGINIQTMVHHGLMIVFGICFNRMYFKHCKKQIQKIKASAKEDENPETILQTKGGVNTALAISLMVTYLIILYLPTFITGLM